MVASVLLALITFTTGPGSLVNPISSNISGYPLLAGAVLTWCLLGGDDRLLPLTVGVLSFTAQAHLAAAPTVALLGATSLVGVGLAWGRAGVLATRRPPPGRPPRRGIGRARARAVGAGHLPGVPR